MSCYNNNQLQLGINIDHVATIRQARKTPYPNIIAAAKAAEDGGADFITVHLREDRRHIIDEDLPQLNSALKTHMNLEMATTDEMAKIALDILPRCVCIVPEKRQELTTEGGLNVCSKTETLSQFCKTLTQANIEVSLFIDPIKEQIDAAKAVGVKTIELHTGLYSEDNDISKITYAVNYAKQLGFNVNAGHGLRLDNVLPIARLPIRDLNIGHSIVARALFVGLKKAVEEMKSILQSVQ